MKTLLLALAALILLWICSIIVLYLIGRRWLAREVMSFLPNTIGMFRGLARDPRVSRIDKALLLAGLFWLASPIDLIPEFIPFLGPLDDAIIAILILRRIVRRAGRMIAAEHWRGDLTTLERLFRVARIAA